MRLHFNPNQKHQLDAIKAVLRVFEGQSAGSGSNAFLWSDPDEKMLAETGFANHLEIDEEQILKNVQAIQREEREKEERELGEQGEEDRCKWTISDELDGMHFSVEMETGAGKTYVYLRTIYELNRKYGFRKFVIVVLSVAIREGVLKKGVIYDSARDQLNLGPVVQEGV